MSDPRLTLMRDGLATAGLEGVLEADAYAPATAMHCVAATAAIRKSADEASEQQDQLVFGEAFDVLAEDSGFVFGQARRDGYVGWVEAASLAPGAPLPTHWVSALRTLVFSRPDLKSSPVMALTMNSLVHVETTEGRFVKIAGGGWVFEGHISTIGTYETDPVAVAARFEGAPYLWGGRESGGLDCSGLIQQAHYACAIPSARDTDMQAALGKPVAHGDLTRGDLVFWKGHVGLLSDAETLLHANAHHMACEEEPLVRAVQRIAAVTGSEPVAYRRI